MEGSLSTADFLALENRGYGYHDDCYYRRHSGAATTGIGLAAGLGGGALLLAIAGLWGINQASKARSLGAMAGIGANTASIAALNNNIASERLSRETWQTANQPSIQSYIDVQATPSATSASTATAEALALAAAINNNSLNSAIGTESFVRVQQYSAPQPCACPCSCNG